MSVFLFGLVYGFSQFQNFQFSVDLFLFYSDITLKSMNWIQQEKWRKIRRTNNSLQRAECCWRCKEPTASMYINSWESWISISLRLKMLLRNLNTKKCLLWGQMLVIIFKPEQGFLWGLGCLGFWVFPPISLRSGSHTSLWEAEQQSVFFLALCSTMH